MAEEKDQQLAAFTDLLLQGQPLPPDYRPPLAETVERLAAALQPQPPPEQLYRRVQRAVARGWRRSNAPQGGWWRQLFRRPQRRWVWAAVVAALLLVVAAVLLSPAPAEGMAGTAHGVEPWIVALILGAVFIGVVVATWISSRRR